VPHRRSPTLAEAVDDWLEVRSADRWLNDNTRRACRADIDAVARRLVRTPVPLGERAAARVTVAALPPTAVVRALSALQALLCQTLPTVSLPIDRVIQRVITRSAVSPRTALGNLAHGLGVQSDHEISPPIGRVRQDGTELAQRLDC
jgi:hypothetical protein